MKINVIGSSSYEMDRDGIIVKSHIYTPPPEPVPEGKVWNGVLGIFIDEDIKYPFEVDEEDTIFGPNRFEKVGEDYEDPVDELARAAKEFVAKMEEQEDLSNRESAIEAAIEYLENEGDEIQRNPFGKGWAIKAGYGKDGNPINPEKGVKEALLEALVEDAAPKDMTLEEHDRQHHPKGFNPETDTCKFRERLATETETDKGDILDKDKSSGSKETSETSNGIVSPEDDRKYLDAVERGDMKTAQKMVDAVAKRYFGDSAVLGKVWHNTKKKFTEFKNSFPNVFFFAKDKKWADKFGSDERYSGKENTKAYYLDIQKPIDMRAEKSGKDWLSYFAEQGIEIGENGKNKLERFGDRVIPGYAILNHDSSEPYGTGFRDAMVKAGFDGAILEDIKRGTADRTSYGAFNSTGIKSADAVTYDDNGNVIPLSRRFDKGTDIRGDISGNQSEHQNGKAEQDNTRVYEGLSNKQVKKYKDLMGKKHPELDADLVLTELGKIKDKDIQGDALVWVMRGAVKLPEDLYKVEQARELATKAKKDPLSYNTPQDCINELIGDGHKIKEKPINGEGNRINEDKYQIGEWRLNEDVISLPNGTEIPKSLSYLYTDSKGNLHNEKWSVAREKKLGDGRISKEYSTVLDTLFEGNDVSDEEIMALPEWKEAMELEKDLEGRLQKEYGVTRTKDINTKARNRFRNAIVEAALGDHISKTVPIEGFEGKEFETNEGLEEGESYDVEKGKKVFIAIGLPAAGKSTTFANPLARKYKARLCDSDTVKKVLPEFANGYGGNLVHDESTEINERILAGAIENGDNIVYPILGYKSEKLTPLIKLFKDKGYEVNLCFKDMPANIAKGRLLGRFLQKGRYLPLNCISKAQGRVGESFDAVKELADSYIRASSDPDGSNEKIIESKGSIL